VRNVAKSLESRGLIQAVFTDGGTVHASITGDGALLVEQSGNTGVIPAFRSNPNRFLVSVN
jgi:hypothetical protein